MSLKEQIEYARQCVASWPSDVKQALCINENLLPPMRENASLQQQLEAERVKVAMLRELLTISLSNETCCNGAIIDHGEPVEQCQFCCERDEALSEFSDNDAWMREQKAKVLEDAAKMFDSGDWFARDKLQRMAAELRN